MSPRSTSAAGGIPPRQLEPELMDQPGLDPALHRGALEGLRRLNRISRSAALLWNPVADTAARCHPRVCRIADLACGGGDVAVALARWAARGNVELAIDGFDQSRVAIEYAAARARQQGCDNLRFHQADVFEFEPAAPYDIVMCSLFLHHLSEPDAVRLLARMRAMTETCLLVNDLRRTRRGELLVTLGCRLVTRSPIVQVDGPMSARAAFSVDELEQLAQRAGLSGFHITRHWPQRMLLRWSGSCR